MKLLNYSYVTNFHILQSDSSSRSTTYRNLFIEPADAKPNQIFQLPLASHLSLIVFICKLPC